MNKIDIIAKVCNDYKGNMKNLYQKKLNKR